MSGATSRPPSHRRRMSRAERERQMLDVAEQVFGERGFQATSMDEIAERCGVSKPMLYEYFGSKDGLLVACVSRSKAELFDVTRKAMAGATTPEDILWRGMVAYFEFIDEHSRSFAMLLREPTAASPETIEAVESTRRQQSTLIAGVLATFAPSAPSGAVAAYTEIIIGASERLAQWQTSRPDVSAKDAARYMTDFCWKGLSPYLSAGEAPPEPR
ncbi:MULTISPECIES: TetR/AcrR family transcriptional regulator [Actinomadura]|uniref:DNA-binding transcriptional regulator, AcrR family n=1 Tax=Actinomadura madurae TaxID=1993 RepID=A0A1I5QDY4_9ACTN|nr:TetR/AcrR family transcriptional regulator [Actinomadura madurae]SFP44492.1 DNA-binding transcriptional regulator, AcrR family [Actinomadura madurae]SPT58926.1 HTH-type transcriptional regulator EthR [Actinomadura madurae]